MDNESCLTVGGRVRGVLPTKVSQLENDCEYITSEQLEGIVVANQMGTYSGAESESAKVLVDNLNKTITVQINITLEGELGKLLPSTGGSLEDGIFLLRASVSNGVPTFSFVSDSYSSGGNYYYGNTSANVNTLTKDIIKSLSNGGSEEGNKEYSFSSYKQRQVFAYPFEFGPLSRIEHSQTGLNVIDLFEVKELVVDGIGYYAYISSAPSTGEYTYKFIY